MTCVINVPSVRWNSRIIRSSCTLDVIVSCITSPPCKQIKFLGKRLDWIIFWKWFGFYGDFASDFFVISCDFRESCNVVGLSHCSRLLHVILYRRKLFIGCRKCQEIPRKFRFSISQLCWRLMAHSFCSAFSGNCKYISVFRSNFLKNCTTNAPFQFYFWPQIHFINGKSIQISKFVHNLANRVFQILLNNLYRNLSNIFKWNFR